MSTTGHESEVVQVQGLKASLKKGGNKGIYNEAICSTAGGTAAKVTNTVPPSFSLTSGATIIVKFTYAITVADATLKVGDADAKPIYYQGAALLANKVKAGTSLLLRYNGTVWNIIGMLGNDSAAAYTPTLSSAPTSSTTTYTKDGETLPFEIGQFCRVADASMDTGYKFYQLADLSNGVAAWQEMGTALERVTISVTSNQAASVTSTLRSSAVITVEDEDGQQVYSGTMPQSTMVKMTPGKRYTISAGSVSGFTAPQPQTIDAEYEGVHSIDMEYQTELVSVSLSKNTGSGDLSGVGITIKDSSDNTLGSGTGSITDLTVAYGTQYHVVLTDNPDHYIAPDTSAVYTAGQASRSIALQYTEYSQGQVTVVPTAKTLTYSGEAQELVTAGQGTGTMMYKLGDGEWSSSIPTATAAGSYEVKYKAAAEGTYYESAEGTVSVSIAKANPSYTAPTAKSGLVYSGDAQTLLNAGSTSDGEISYSSDGTTWGQNIPTATDANESIAVYWKLTGDSNHNDVASTLVSVSIAKADITPYVSMAGWTYGGTESNPSVSGNAGGGEVSYLYKVQGAADSTYTTGKPSDVGDYTIKAEIAATSNYNAGTATADFTIAKAAPSYTAPTGKSLTYNGSMQDLLNEGSTAHGTMKYSSDGSTWSASVPQGQNAGEYTLYWKIEGDSNHSDIASTEISASVAKVTPTVIIPTAKVLVYNTSAQELVNAGSSDFGTMKYSLDGTDYSTSIPAATDYGTYTVYYKVDGDSNVNSTAAATVACSISEKEVSTPTIELTPSSFTYSGSACTPTVVVKDGSHVIPSSEYTVTFSNNTNAGTATVTIADNTGGNYNITGSTTFNIAKADPTYTAPTAKTGLVYDNTDKALLNAASNVAGGTVKYSSDGTSWSTSIPTGKNAGSYSPQWKIEGDSNHNGKAAAAISVSIAKVTPTVTAPTAKSLTFTGSAQTLANAGSTNWGTLQYSSDNSSWSTSIPTGTNAGTSYKVYYRVVGNSNINDVASASINCSIGKASPSYTAPTAKSGLVYTGSAQALLNAGSTSHGTIQYSSDNSNWSSTIPSQTNANTSGYTSYWRLVGDSNHSDVASTSLKTTIAKASLSASVSMSGWTYGGAASSPSVSGNSGSGSVTYSYKVQGAADSTYTSTKPSNAGSYTVRAVIAETTNYNGTTVTTNFTIAKATGSATVTGKSSVYSRGTQNLLSVSGNTGTMHYRVGTSGSWTTTIPSSTSVTSVTIYYYMDASTNYTARGSQSSPWGSVTGAVTKATPVLSTSPSYRTGLVYNGSAQNLLSGGAMKHSSSDTTAVSGTFTYDQGTNAGTYSSKKWYFTPSDTTNYNSTEGTVSGSATIAQASRTISFTTAPGEVKVGAQITVAASLSAGSGTITYSSGDTSIATVSGATVTGVAEGSVSITASVPASGNYAAASVSYILEVKEDNFVDLGLSVKWAKGNICKDSNGNYYIGEPTDKGCYYSWGNIEGHNKGEGYNFSSSTYKSTPGKSLTANIASNDSAHDAALACLGTGKRMPTKAEFDELIDNCTVTWVTSYNGVSVAGRVFKSKKAGYTDKEIFIPASGYYNGSTLNNEGSYGIYWSSTYYFSSYAYYLYFNSSNVGTDYLDRYCGLSVRAVQ